MIGSGVGGAATWIGQGLIRECAIKLEKVMCNSRTLACIPD